MTSMTFSVQGENGGDLVFRFKARCGALGRSHEEVLTELMEKVISGEIHIENNRGAE